MAMEAAQDPEKQPMLGVAALIVGVVFTMFYYCCCKKKAPRPAASDKPKSGQREKKDKLE